MGVATKLGWRLYTTLSGVLAAFLVRKALSLIWRRTTGHKPPERPQSPETTGVEAFGWMALTGVAVEGARLLAARRGAESWRGHTGHLPPGLEARAR
jgi:hypothetical protein